MLGRKKGFSAKQSRRMSRRMHDSTIGTHVNRGTHSRQAPNANSVSFSNTRSSNRASNSEVRAMAPSATSGEDSATYSRRARQRQYIAAVQHRANVRRAIVGAVTLLAILAIASTAAFLAFRGSVGSELALRNSNAAEALVAAKSDEPHYTLITAELGAVADPLQHEGPDAMLLVRVDPTAHTMAVVNVPSSLQVSVDNDSYRIAEIAAKGDAAFISAVANFTKLDIAHFVKLGEGDIVGMVDALGGVEVNLEQTLDDPHAGDVYLPNGTQTLDGQAALTYVRSDNFRLGTDDQFRNQTDFVAQLLGKLFGADGSFATRLESIDSFFQTDMSMADLEAVANWMRDVPASDITRKVLPGYMTSTAGVVDVGDPRYVASSSDMAALIASLEGGEQAESAESSSVATVDPGSFTIEVQNGTDIAGAASITSEMLAAAGFRVEKTGNAEQQVYQETLVVYNTTDKSRNSASGSGVAPEDGETGDGFAEDGDEGDAEGDGAADDGAQTTRQDGADSAATDEELAERGLARANTVIEALGLGRAVEAGTYYDFKTDVLVVVGYDYKPVM